MTIVATIQAVYFIVTGVWALVHIRSFMAVTGPKVELWLVKTVGVLVLVIGVVLAAAAWSGRVTIEIAILAVGSAFALTAIDVIYVARRVIDKIYLLDAAAEVILIVAWLATYSAR